MTSNRTEFPELSPSELSLLAREACENSAMWEKIMGETGKTMGNPWENHRETGKDIGKSCGNSLRSIPDPCRFRANPSVSGGQAR